LVRPRGGEEPLVVHAGDHVLELSVVVLGPHLRVEGLEAGREDHSRDINFFLLGRLIEVYGGILTDTLADSTFLVLEVETALIDIRDEGNCLSEVYVNSLVRRYFLVELIGVLDRAVLYAGGTPRALVLNDIPRLLGKGYLEVSRFPLYPVNLGIGEDLYVRMPADLDQLGCEYSHRAVVRRKGLVELGHMAPDARRPFDEVDFEAGGREIEGRLDAADPSADDHDVSEVILPEVLADLLDIVLERYYVFHLFSPQQVFCAPIARVRPVSCLSSLGRPSRSGME